MKPHEFIGISCKIHRLAWLNWVKDGRPAGLDVEYWLAAENLLVTSKTEILANQKPEPGKLKDAHATRAHSRSAFDPRKKLRNSPGQPGSIESPQERAAL